MGLPSIAKCECSYKFLSRKGKKQPKSLHYPEWQPGRMSSVFIFCFCDHRLAGHANQSRAVILTLAAIIHCGVLKCADAYVPPRGSGLISLHVHQESVMPSNHLISCHPLLLLSIFPSIRVFPKESVLHIRWPKFWCFSFSISPSNEYLGQISFRMDWFGLLAVQGKKRVGLIETVALKHIPYCMLNK